MENLTIKDLSVNEEYIKVSNNLPKIPFNMIMTACSMSGKSNLIKNMIVRDDFYKKYFKRKHIFIFCKTHSNTLYSIKGANIFSELVHNDQNILEVLFETQKKIKDMGKKPPHILIIMDDFIVDKAFQKRRGLMTKLFSAGRNYNMSIILTSQQYTLIPSDIRRLALYSITFKLNNSAEKKAFLTEFHGHSKIENFEKMLNVSTAKPYNFLLTMGHEVKYFHNFTREFDYKTGDYL